MARGGTTQKGSWHDLTKKGKYKAALALLDRRLTGSRDDGIFQQRAHLHLYLGNTQQARSDFDTAARLSADVFKRIDRGQLHSDLEYAAIGATYWIEGRRELALAFWRYTARLLYQGSVSYSFMGGGIETGLLLWFGATWERLPDDVALVRRLYEKRLASTFWSHSLAEWPGPLVRFFFKEIDEATLIEQASESCSHRCRAHFAAAIRARELRRYSACNKHLKLVVGAGTRPDTDELLFLTEYFLARHELASRR
jgi:hypothetical protein